jgi:hypothetical protein
MVSSVSALLGKTLSAVATSSRAAPEAISSCPALSGSSA